MMIQPFSMFKGGRVNPYDLYIMDKCAEDDLTDVINEARRIVNRGYCADIAIEQALQRYGIDPETLTNDDLTKIENCLYRR